MREPGAHDAEVVGLAPTGEGVARLGDGRRLLVAGALPGERVSVSPDGRRGRLLRVVEPAPGRREPPCGYAERCGGCDLMHADAALASRLHLSRVRELFERITTVPAIVQHAPAPEVGYRARARLHVRAGKTVAIGYHAARSHELVAVECCLVLRPELDAALGSIAAALSGSRGEGELSLALGSGRLPVVELRWKSGAPATESYVAFDEQVKRGAWAGARIWAEGAREPARFGDPTPRAIGADGLELELSEGGFAQASEEGGQALARRTAELVVGGGRVIELFAGSGTLSILLAAKGAPFVAVEEDPMAALRLRANLARRGLEAKVHVADANSFALPKPTRTVVLDPPRAGAPGAVKIIVQARPSEVVYVSCDMVTLARDVATLVGGGYRLSELELFELFPQTSHVELVARLTRGK